MSAADADESFALFLPGNRSAFSPGEVIAVAVLWALPAAPTALEVRLFWFTRGKGTDDVGVVASQRIPAPPAAGEQTLEFRLPHAPYSFSGKLISLTWAFEFYPESGQPCARVEFVLGPGQKEVLLSGDDHGASA